MTHTGAVQQAEYNQGSWKKVPFKGSSQSLESPKIRTLFLQIWPPTPPSNMNGWDMRNQCVKSRHAHLGHTHAYKKMQNDKYRVAGCFTNKKTYNEKKILHMRFDPTYLPFWPGELSTVLNLMLSTLNEVDQLHEGPTDTNSPDILSIEYWCFCFMQSLFCFVYSNSLFPLLTCPTASLHSLR